MHVVMFYSETDPDYFEEWRTNGTRMMEILTKLEGFVDVHYMKMDDGRDFAIAYFDSEEAIGRWYRDAEHVQAMKAGRDHIFKDYKIEVAEIVRAYTKSTSLFDTLVAD
jgi:heme-degrading monooxygenase HmoA